jgi:hypothetical protein
VVGIEPVSRTAHPQPSSHLTSEGKICYAGYR